MSNKCVALLEMISGIFLPGIVVIIEICLLLSNSLWLTFMFAPVVAWLAVLVVPLVYYIGYFRVLVICYDKMGECHRYGRCFDCVKRYPVKCKLLRAIFSYHLSLLAIFLVYIILILASVIVKKNVVHLDNKLCRETILDQQLCPAINMDEQTFVVVGSTYRYCYIENGEYCVGSIPFDNVSIIYIESKEVPRVVGFHEWETEQYQYGNAVKEYTVLGKLIRSNVRTRYVFYLPEDSVAWA